MLDLPLARAIDGQQHLPRSLESVVIPSVVIPLRRPRFPKGRRRYRLRLIERFERLRFFLAQPLAWPFFVFPLPLRRRLLPQRFHGRLVLHVAREPDGGVDGGSVAA